jgi:membrane-associated phospholipid phosphatase
MIKSFFNPSQDIYSEWQERIKARRWYRILVAFCGIYSILLFAPLAWYMLQQEDGMKVIALCLIALVFTRGIVTETIYYFHKKLRPYQQYTFTPVSSMLFSRVSSRNDSFPSGHTVAITSMSTVLAWYLPFYGIAGFLIALLVAFGRVRLGNHYPVDILAGFLVGITCGFLTIALAGPFVLKI